MNRRQFFELGAGALRFVRRRDAKSSLRGLRPPLASIPQSRCRPRWRRDWAQQFLMEPARGLEPPFLFGALRGGTRDLAGAAISSVPRRAHVAPPDGGRSPRTSLSSRLVGTTHELATRRRKPRRRRLRRTHRLRRPARRFPPGSSGQRVSVPVSPRSRALRRTEPGAEKASPSREGRPSRRKSSFSETAGIFPESRSKSSPPRISSMPKR